MSVWMLLIGEENGVVVGVLGRGGWSERDGMRVVDALYRRCSVDRALRNAFAAASAARSRRRWIAASASWMAWRPSSASSWSRRRRSSLSGGWFDMVDFGGWKREGSRVVMDGLSWLITEGLYAGVTLLCGAVEELSESESERVVKMKLSPAFLD